MKKNDFFKLLASLSLISLSSYSFALSPLVTSGSYLPSTGGMSPFFLAKQADNSWSFMTKLSLPADFTRGDINAVQCDGMQCLATGGYTGKAGYLPLLLTSSTGGASWTVATVTGLPTNLQYGTLVTVSCNGTLCVAAGTEETASAGQPLLLVSNDDGQSWSYVNNIGGLPTFDSAALSQLRQTAGNQMVAAGIDMNKKLHDPLVLTSDKTGAWSTVTLPSLPTGYRVDKVSGLSCSGSMCALVGAYTPKNANEPLIMISGNQGANWSYVTSVVNLPTDIRYAELSTIQCDGAVCVAAGDMTTNTGTVFPLLVKSKDSGKTWSYQSAISNMPALQYINFFSMQCTGSACIATGRYQTGSDDLPLLLVSQNQGESWTLVTKISSFPYFTSAFLNEVSCDGNDCTAVGGYDDGQQGNQLLIIESLNHGLSWSYVNNISGIPVGLNYASLIHLTSGV